MVKGPIQVLDDTKLTAETQYSINFIRSNQKFCSNLYYNGSNRAFHLLLIQKYINSKQ